MIPIGAVVLGTINGVPHRGIVERIDPDDTFGPRLYLTDGYSILARNIQSWAKVK